MARILVTFVVWVLILASTPVWGQEGEKTKASDTKIPFEVHSGYFESNKSGLKGASSYLVIADQKKFDELFGVAFVMGKRPNVLPPGAFDKKMVLAVIKRGREVWSYKVQKISADRGTVLISYQAKARSGGGSATFASPLIVSINKDKFSSAVFIENGKQAAKVQMNEE